MNATAAPLAVLLDDQAVAELAGAACRGLAPMFDADIAGETAPARRRRLQVAVGVCASCPVTEACAIVAAAIPPADRSGMWAGRLHRPRPRCEGCGQQLRRRPARGSAAYCDDACRKNRWIRAHRGRATRPELAAAAAGPPPSTPPASSRACSPRVDPGALLFAAAAAAAGADDPVAAVLAAAAAIAGRRPARRRTVSNANDRHPHAGAAATPTR